MAVKNITTTGYEVLIEKSPTTPEIRISGERGQKHCTIMIKPLESMDQARVFQMSLTDLDNAAVLAFKLSGMEKT